MSLRLVPISLAQANEHVSAWHRHNEPVVQCIYRVGVSDGEGVLRAVAIVENPKARGNADGDTVEITRLASDGTRNACSMLYGACARAAFALGPEGSYRWHLSISHPSRYPTWDEIKVARYAIPTVADVEFMAQLLPLARS